MSQKRREPYTSSVPPESSVPPANKVQPENSVQPKNKVQCVRPLVHARRVLGESSPNSVPASAVLVEIGQVTTTVLSKDNKARLAEQAAAKQARLAEAEQARLAEEASVRALHGELVAAMQFIEQAKQAEQAEIYAFFELVKSEPSAAARVEDAESYEQFQALCMNGK